MDSRKLLRLTVVALVSLLLVGAASEQQPNDRFGLGTGSSTGAGSTDFSATNQGNSVDVNASQARSGASASSERSDESSGPGESSGSNRRSGSRSSSSSDAAAPPPITRPTCITSDNLSPNNGVGFCPAPPPATGDPAAPQPPPEQLQLGAEDVASLAPSNGLLSAEPGDWALVGLPFNPVASAEPQTVTGELLGALVEVRFTPVAFHWDYGDRTSRSSADGGGTWAQLGQREFTETPTSHVYTERGAYQLVLLLEQTAEYRVLAGGGWQTVAGTVVTEAASQSIEVGAAGTVLVDRSCNEGPRGPGC